MNSQVTAFVNSLNIAIKEAVEALHNIILSAHPEIAGHIKWNSPAFYYTGVMASFDPKTYKRDTAVMNLNRNRLMLVLPTGTRLTDNTGLLEGKYTDGRGIINFKDKADIEAKAPVLQSLLRQWVDMVEK
ncbi:DUF1801 domain-containing protein [Mucilaginibacter conchicola]|uniref:DUF1801 domain-containing protein n=1 Tax=Mucilaginibacter conchicola TaxID=2303333 RepID=A0A372NNB4_9SPHI|nr:DUF1801 domain-containing protein [Mucilaginibacter conchicola]RFZ90421.1 DUF1801 domain-containing protein [Mucilaginibacter conchicola]